MDLPTLQTLKDDLLQTRRAAQSATAALLTLQRPFDETIQHLHREHMAREDVQAAQHRTHRAAETLAATEQRLREALIAHYHATKEKSPLPGLGVRVSTTTTPRITDREGAMQWAADSAPDLLDYAPVLNDAGVLAYHAHIKALPFVEVTTTTRVTASIAKEL